MKLSDIQRLRVTGFTESRKGYDRDEVDRFLAELAGWLEVELKEESTGQKVAGAFEEIIVAAERSATEIRQSAEGEAAKLLEQMRRQSASIREKAEVEARQLIDESHKRANEIRAAAKAKADEQRAAAERQASETIRSARTEAENRRSDAARAAKEQLAEASAEADRIVSAADEDRRDLETMVIALERRRKAVHSGLDKIRRALAELPGE
jgi:DivIVA domain-containing protein